MNIGPTLRIMHLCPSRWKNITARKTGVRVEVKPQFPRPCFSRIDFHRLPTTTSVRFNSHVPSVHVPPEIMTIEVFLFRGISPAIRRE